MELVICKISVVIFFFITLVQNSHSTLPSKTLAHNGSNITNDLFSHANPTEVANNLGGVQFLANVTSQVLQSYIPELKYNLSVKQFLTNVTSQVLTKQAVDENLIIGFTVIGIIIFLAFPTSGALIKSRLLNMNSSLVNANSEIEMGRVKTLRNNRRSGRI